MVHWIISETNSRRDEILQEALQQRLSRLTQNQRSSNIRGRIADSAQQVSDLLASFAQGVRAKG